MTTRRLVQLVVLRVMRARHHLAVTGTPPERPVLLVANHSSHLDTLAVLAALAPSGIAPRVAAAEDYFFRRPMLGSALARLIGAFPFPRERGCRAGLRRCWAELDRGESVLLFPEGTRTGTGADCRFKPGVGLLAGRGPVAVAFGEPMRFPGGEPAAIAAQLAAQVNLLVAAAEARIGPTDTLPVPRRAAATSAGAGR